MRNTLKTITMITALTLGPVFAYTADDGEKPLELALLREKRDLKVRQLDSAYAVELEKLTATFTRQGKLDNANAVVAKIRAIQGGHV